MYTIEYIYVWVYSSLDWPSKLDTEIIVLLTDDKCFASIFNKYSYEYFIRLFAPSQGF